MMKTAILAAAALSLTAGAAAADAWEAVAVSDGAVIAVDWASMNIRGNMRQINTALVAAHPEPGQFDWATSMVDFDCSQARYKTLRSHFFYIDGSSASDDYMGDGSWTTINAGTLMDDVRTQVCGASMGKQGYFDDPLTFAVTARQVLAEQG